MSAKTMAVDSPGSTVDLTDHSVCECVLSDPGVVLVDHIDHIRCRYPYCIVWTPVPWLTWILPFIGHMGICTSSGIIRDFSAPQLVSEDKMAFGNPTKYWQLSAQKAVNGQAGWDAAVFEASEIFKKKMAVSFFYNCHSHVTTALNIMTYDGSNNWNQPKLIYCVILYSSYVRAFMKTWIPLLIIVSFIVGLVAIINGHHHKHWY